MADDNDHSEMDNPYARDDQPHAGSRSSGGRTFILSDDERERLARQREMVQQRIIGAR